MGTASHTMSTFGRIVASLALGAVLAAGAANAQELSGSASGGGAIQGGSGAPGGGVGIPGAIVNDTTATGIGEDDTLSRHGGAPVMAATPDFSKARAYYPIDAVAPAPRLRHARHRVIHAEVR